MQVQRDVHDEHSMLYLDEGDLLEGDGALLPDLAVQGGQNGQHARHVGVPKVQARRLLQGFVPLLMPQDGHAYELGADLAQAGQDSVAC